MFENNKNLWKWQAKDSNSNIWSSLNKEPSNHFAPLYWRCTCFINPDTFIWYFHMFSQTLYLHDLCFIYHKINCDSASPNKQVHSSNRTSFYRTNKYVSVKVFPLLIASVVVQSSINPLFAEELLIELLTRSEISKVKPWRIPSKT